MTQNEIRYNAFIYQSPIIFFNHILLYCMIFEWINNPYWDSFVPFEGPDGASLDEIPLFVCLYYAALPFQQWRCCEPFQDPSLARRLPGRAKQQVTNTRGNTSLATGQSSKLPTPVTIRLSVQAKLQVTNTSDNTSLPTGQSCKLPTPVTTRLSLQAKLQVTNTRENQVSAQNPSCPPTSPLE